MATKPAVIQKAHEMVSALCDGRRGWIMSIPARPDHDPDLVIGEALSVADEMYTALEKAHQWFAFMEETSDGNENPDDDRLEAAAYRGMKEQCAKALAKARGEVPDAS